MTYLPATTRRRFLQAASVVVAASSLPRVPSAAAAESASLALDWYPNANHAGIYLGQARGYFESAGISLEPYSPSDPTTVLQTVGAGRDEFGISYQTDVLLAREQGVPVVSVAALVQQPLVSVMTLASIGVTTPADLVGMEVGYPGIPSQRALLETMLEQVGATLDDVTLVNIGFNLVPALISEQVDAVLGAYWTHETILAEQEGYPVDFLRVEAWGVPSYYELVVVTSESMLENQPDTVTAFLSALQHGYVDSIDEPEAALDALSDAYPELDREVEEEGIVRLAPVWLSVAPYFGYQNPERWQNFAAWMVSRELISGDLEVESAFRADLLPQPAATPTT